MCPYHCSLLPMADGDSSEQRLPDKTFNDKHYHIQ